MATINGSSGAGLVDQFGEPIYTSLYHAAAPELRRRSWWPTMDRDSDRDITPWTLSTIRSHSRRCYYNFPPIRKSINDKADYSISSAWAPRFRGKEKDWGKTATELLTENWFPVCNVRGPNFDFRKSLYLESVSIDRDGDVFIVLTEDDGGYPMFQHIPAHRIGDRSNLIDQHRILKQGPYKGLEMYNGVVTNSYHRPVAFHVLGDQPASDQFVSARDMIHVGEPDAVDNTRFMPCLASAINDLRDQMMIMGYEKQAAALFSSLALIEKKRTPGVNSKDPRARAMLGFGNDPVSNLQGPVVEYMDGGATRHILTDEEVQALIADRPTNGWNSLMDRLVRQAISSVWRYELSYDNSQLKGPGVRFSIMEARSAVSRRQNILKPSAKRRVQYAVAKFIKLGVLAPNPEWWKWDFIMPETLSIDDGRENSILLSLYNAGLINESEYLASRGRTMEDHAQERVDEIITKMRIRDEAEEDSGFKIDDREMRMFTPNDAAGVADDSLTQEDQIQEQIEEAAPTETPAES